MKLSVKTKVSLLALLAALDIILRLQVVPNEIGADSFLVHVMANSISEFGYAKWVLHPLSFWGMYPSSDVSALPFFLSGIFQSTGIEMRWIIFLYSILLGLLSIFTAYLMAGAVIDDDFFRLLSAFAFSTSPAVLGYSTWTIPARGLFVVLAPLLVYMLLKCPGYIWYIPLIILFAVFLYATHHLFYFLLPVFFAFFILLVLFKFKEHIIKILAALAPLISTAGFFLMFSIPFFTGRFIEVSRYSPIHESYVRYAGILIIPAFGGVISMMFKLNKSFGEWLLLLSITFLTTLVYEQTYMKWFLPIFVILFAGLGLVNIARSKKRYALAIVAVFMILSISFSGYYQFLHFSPTGGLSERYIEESTYTAGRWMKEYASGSVVSNDRLFGTRLAATSETVHFLTPYTLLNFIYEFVTVNLSEFEWYPITSDEFWFDVGESKIEYGEQTWDLLNLLYLKPYDFNITYFAENTKAGGDIIWHHGRYPSKLLQQAYAENALIYDGGTVRLWELK